MRTLARRECERVPELVIKYFLYISFLLLFYIFVCVCVDVYAMAYM